MHHRLLVFPAVALFVASAASVARPQTSSSAEPVPAPGQSSSANGSAVAPAPAPPAGKKVWTNDDVSDLRGDSVISTVGNSDAKPGSKPAPAAKNKNAKPYQAQIERLEAQIPPLDAQIAELQAAIDGKPTGDMRSSQRPRGVKADDWSVEMQDLQKKHDNILDQISALKDQARHQGVAPNALP